MKIQCQKCKRLFDDSLWESGKTYNGIDRHHNPPEFICSKLNELWVGELYCLCRECHTQLHREIKIILNDVAKTLKFCNSEDWCLKKMNLLQVQESKEKVYLFTKKWVEENGNP